MSRGDPAVAPRVLGHAADCLTGRDVRPEPASETPPLSLPFYPSPVQTERAALLLSRFGGRIAPDIALRTIDYAVLVFLAGQGPATTGTKRRWPTRSACPSTRSTMRLTAFATATPEQEGASRLWHCARAFRAR